MPEIMARVISLKYFWFLLILKVDISSDGKVLVTGSNVTTRSSSHVFKNFSIQPV